MTCDCPRFPTIEALWNGFANGREDGGGITPLCLGANTFDTFRIEWFWSVLKLLFTIREPGAKLMRLLLPLTIRRLPFGKNGKLW